VPPVVRPIPRHIAEPPHELQPAGRWAQQLGRRFLAACSEIDTQETLSQPELDAIAWYPERSYGGRTYVPATAINDQEVEFFGFVSFATPKHSDPRDFLARADYTHETAAGNPDWKIDLNEEVIGSWRGPGQTTADITLVWGNPLVPGAVAATAEVDEQTADQCAIVQTDRFTLVALDAISGFGGLPIYLEVVLWNKRGGELARESLYESESDEGEAQGDEAPMRGSGESAAGGS
jgi:hypothetical protein